MSGTKQVGIKQFLRQISRKLGQFALQTSLPEVLLIASLVIAKYLPNSDFSYPSEIVLPIIVFAFVVTPLFYLYKVILKDLLAAHIAGLLLAYGLYGYSYAYPRLKGWADGLVPSFWQTPFVSMLAVLLLWGVLFGLFGFGIAKLLPRLKFLKDVPFVKIGVFAICFIFAVQLVKVGERLWTIRRQLDYSYQSQLIQKTPVKDADRPNIYYMVFDRYASAETLDRSYDYDNTAMVDFLAGQGFVTREHAYANYPFTPQSVSSTLALDYHTDLGRLFKNDAAGFQTAFPYRSILNNPPIADVLKNEGYAYNQISSWWDFTRNNPTADAEPSQSFRLRVLGKAFWLTDLQRDIVNKSILSPLLLKGFSVDNVVIVKYDQDNNPRENFEKQISSLKAIAEKSNRQTLPQFTFAHVLSPHDPYVFNEDGGDTAYSVDRNDDGIDETQKYARQLTYVNKRFQDLIQTLRQKDPTAVIIIQADEGPYPKEFRGELLNGHFYDPSKLPDAQMRQKFGILASYYMPGIEPAIVQSEITSSVNVFRFVLNHYFGYAMTYLPECNFSVGNKFYLYNFQLVTGQLTGNDPPEACKRF